MKKNYSELVFILDRSGSMAATVNDVIGGFNSLIKTQKEATGTATVTLVQFDDQYEAVYTTKDIKEVPDLTTATYSARGMTALYDAVGKTINTVGSRLAALPENKRPEHVIVSIFTDGFENASREFTAEKIKSMITEQQDKYSWQIVFIGANQDAVLTASTLGIKPGAAMTYAANSQGTLRAYDSLNFAMSSARFSGQSMTFSDSDREKQTEVGA